MKDTKEEVKQKILDDSDFINSKKYGYSLKKYLKNNPVSPDNIVAHLLCISTAEVQEIYDDAVAKIRQFMEIDL